MIMLVTGILLYFFIFADIVYTTFSLRGGGYLTGRTALFIWKILLNLSRLVKHPKLLQSAGMIVITVIFLQWLLLVWGANVLIVSSDPNAIIHSQTKLPADTWEKIYVTGYTLSTMGNGDYSGGNSGWKVYLAVLSLTGIVMVTISLTYFVQVLSNVNKKRVLANIVSGLGTNVEAILQNAWNGNDYTSLNAHLLQLSQQVTTLGEIHLSFPVLHYYYSHRPSKSLAIGIVLLDETLTVLYTRVAPEKRPDALIMRATRFAITDFMETLHSNFIDKGSTTPPLPTLEKAEAAGLVLKPYDPSPEEKRYLEQRRRLLLGLLQNEGREWEDVLK